LSGIKLPELGGTEVGKTDAGKAETQKPAEVPQKKALRNDLLTAAEAAAFLKVTEGELRDLRRRKRVAYSKLGYRSIRFRQQDLDDFIERYRVSAIGEPIRRSVKG
jgi:excisionase family DNA binding protein